MEKKFTVIANHQPVTDDYTLVLQSWTVVDGERTNEVSRASTVADFDAVLAVISAFKNEG